MPDCPLIPDLPIGLPPDGMPPIGFPEVLAAPGLEAWNGLAVTVPEAIEFISQHALISIAVAGGFGLLIGWLAKRRSTGDASSALPEPLTPGFRELKWRHEKLVLTERQQAEKQSRLDDFVERCVNHATAEEQSVALRLFLLAERVREARQKVGSDLSRMRTVRDRLDEVLFPMERGREAIGACRGMADAQAARLDEAREALRGIADEAVRIEEAALSGTIPPPDATTLRRDLMALKGQVLSLPQGWASSSEETDRRIRELLATVDDPALAPVREILLVDGALTASLAGASAVDLTGAISAAITTLDRIAEAQNGPKPGIGAKLLADLPVSLLSGRTFPDEIPDFGFPQSGQPDAGFRNPLEFAMPVPVPTKGFHDLTNGNGAKVRIGAVPETTTAAVEAADDGERSLVLFCSNDVELWGKTVYRGSRCRARAISEFPIWARWISIRRLDTNESVYAPIRTANLRNGQTADPFGFNGTNELFYGARHLGFFSESCPNEVETRFTYGGWGFGHRALEIAPEVEQLQAAGWEGREIPADTVFEIVIHEELPSLGPNDRLLEGEVRGKMR